jgi:hypothetical protein
MSGEDLFRQDIADARAAKVEARKALDTATHEWLAHRLSHEAWFEIARAYGIASNKLTILEVQASRPMRGPLDVVPQ